MTKSRKIINSIAMPEITMSRSVVCKIMCSIGIHPPETGGILLGPVGTDKVTDFYFDSTAQCSGATYTPDHVTLVRMLKHEWLPAGIDFKGFVHSHPGSFDRLSSGDMDYIARLLARNPDMNYFVAPIVIPWQFRLRPIVVPRDRPRVQRNAILRLF